MIFLDPMAIISFSLPFFYFVRLILPKADQPDSRGSVDPGAMVYESPPPVREVTACDPHTNFHIHQMFCLQYDQAVSHQILPSMLASQIATAASGWLQCLALPTRMAGR